ncbi:MAG: hypothetical protein PHS84_07970 [Paludibacter sp.]|jgi:hypothetical protein|nr:hypothetical protein [Paludibacter sp.]
MKRLIFTLALAVSLVGALSAQVDGKAIGLRFGGFAGDGAEVSYQQPLGNANRLELDLGLNHYGFGLSGVYQWVWDLSSLSDGFNWYAGVGANIGSYNYYSSSPLNVGVLGQIGIEYNFNIPLQLSLDYRPGIFLLNGFYPVYDGICLSARYRF